MANAQAQNMYIFLYTFLYTLALLHSCLLKFTAAQIPSSFATPRPAPYGNKPQLVRDTTFALAPSVVQDRLNLAQIDYQASLISFAQGNNPLTPFTGRLDPAAYAQNPPDFYRNVVAVKGSNAAVARDVADHVARPVAINSPTLIPTLVPGQAGPLPRPDEFVGNTATISLGDLGRSVGLPMYQRYQQSLVGQSQALVGDTLQNVHNTATAPLTSDALNFLEMEPIVQTIEAANNIPATFTRQGFNNPSVWLLRNATEAIFWQQFDFIDPLDSLGSARQVQKDKLKQAEICAMFGNRLPNCPVSPTTLPPPTIPVVAPLPNVVINQYGLATCALVQGFGSSCLAVPGGCFVGRTVEWNQFDGFYQFIGFKADSNAIVAGNQPWPVYAKSATFRNFNTISTIFLTRSVTSGPEFASAFIETLTGGSWASITPQAPNLRAIGLSGRPPFAGTIGVEPPGNCSNLEYTNFPSCATGGRWFVGRATSQCGSRGASINNLCLYTVSVTIQNSGCPPGLRVVPGPSSQQAIIGGALTTGTGP